MHEHIYMCIYILFQILFYHRLSQNIEYSSLCHPTGPCCLSILYIETSRVGLVFVLSFCFFRATPMAYGSSEDRVQSELQLQVYATATAMPDPSRLCDLHHSSWQRWIPDPLKQARDQTRILRDTNWIHFY